MYLWSLLLNAIKNTVWWRQIADVFAIIKNIYVLSEDVGNQHAI